MFNLVSHLLRCAGLVLSRHTPSDSPSPTCVLCSRPAHQVTRCCQTPLCGHHLEAWKNDPNPCACTRR